MKRVFTVMLIATACVVGSTPSFARGGIVHLLTRGGVGHGLGGGFVRNHITPLGASPPASPTFENRIPAPLAAPIPVPVINGPAARRPHGELLPLEQSIA
jgi:hypothetical protein